MTRAAPLKASVQIEFFYLWWPLLIGAHELDETLVTAPSTAAAPLSAMALYIVPLSPGG